MSNFILSILLAIPTTLLGGTIPDSDSLRMELRKNHPDSTEVILLIQLSESRTVGLDSAYLYALRALEISKRIHYNFGLGLSCSSLLSYAKSDHEIDSLMKLSIEFFRKAKNQQYENLVSLKAASRYLIFGNKYVKAFHYANLFLSNYGNDEDPENIAKAWNIIGEVYRISKNYEKAMGAYQRSKKFSVRNGKIIFLSPFINIGTIQLELGHLDSALTHYDFIQDHLVKSNEKESNTFAYIKYRRAQVLLSKGSPKDALKDATEGFEIYQKLGHDEGKILTLSVISQIYFRQGSLLKAINSGRQAIELATKINYAINDIDRVCEVVSKSYYQLKDFRNACHYQSIQNSMKDRLFNPSVTAAWTDELLTLENEKQEIQKELSEEQRTKSESIIRTQKLLNYLAASAVLALLGISFMFYRHAKIKHQLNLQLSEKQEEILAQTEELRAINEEMEGINASLERIVDDRTKTIKAQNLRLRDYAYFNAHKVRGPLARILGLITIIDYDYPDSSFFPYGVMLKTAGNELDGAIREIGNILEAE